MVDARAVEVGGVEFSGMGDIEDLWGQEIPVDAAEEVRPPPSAAQSNLPLPPPSPPILPAPASSSLPSTDGKWSHLSAKQAKKRARRAVAREKAATASNIHAKRISIKRRQESTPIIIAFDAQDFPVASSGWISNGRATSPGVAHLTLAQVLAPPYNMRYIDWQGQ